MPNKKSELEISQRAERIQQTIALLESQKAELERNQVVAPMGSYVPRYQARGQKHRYWYYQLRASSAIFPKAKGENEYSRFQHLGKSGSEAHIDGVLAVVRRNQIDELTRAIESLKQSWLDVYSDEDSSGHRVK